MKYQILADIHGHNVNLERALETGDREGVDSFVCLGDVLGKSGSSLDCLDMLFVRRAIILKGNHDKTCMEDIPQSFQIELKNRMRDDYRVGDLLFAHTATCRDVIYGRVPWDDDRLDTPEKAYSQFNGADFRILFHGHIHQPRIFSSDGSGSVVDMPVAQSTRIVLDPQNRYIINPGPITDKKDIELENPHLKGVKGCLTPSFVIYDTATNICTYRFLR